MINLIVILLVSLLLARAVAFALKLITPATTRQMSLGGEPMKAVTKHYNGGSDQRSWLTSWLSLKVLKEDIRPLAFT